MFKLLTVFSVILVGIGAGAEDQKKDQGGQYARFARFTLDFSCAMSDDSKESNVLRKVFHLPFNKIFEFDNLSVPEKLTRMELLGKTESAEYFFYASSNPASMFLSLVLTDRIYAIMEIARVERKTDEESIAELHRPVSMMKFQIPYAAVNELVDSSDASNGSLHIKCRYDGVTDSMDSAPSIPGEPEAEKKDNGSQLLQQLLKKGGPIQNL